MQAVRSVTEAGHGRSPDVAGGREAERSAQGADEVRACALALARALAAKPPGALAGTKRVMLWGRGRPVEAGLREVALLNSGALWSHDFQAVLARSHRARAKL